MRKGVKRSNHNCILSHFIFLLNKKKNVTIYYKMGGSNKDLTSRDWVAASTKQLVLSIDPSVSVKFVYYPDGGMKIFLNEISEETIGKLSFLTNTDYNNNYLYLEDFYVYIHNNISPLDIPGIKDIVNTFYAQSDVKEFLAGNKIKQPFSPENINKNTSLPPNSSFNDFVDALTSIIPYVESTLGKVKHYEIILNPDQLQALRAGVGARSGAGVGAGSGGMG
jgi:hypothetical protein